jgi:hypothetical protein
MMQFPPPVLDSSRLLAFAINDSEVEFTDRINLFVGSPLERLGEMQGLAICVNYANPDEIFLFFCNSQWEPSGVIALGSVEEAKIKAERGYKGITEKWQESPYTEAETNEYLRNEYQVDPGTKWWETACSFCGKNFFEEGQGISGEKASICRECVEQFYVHFQNEQNGA